MLNIQMEHDLETHRKNTEELRDLTLMIPMSGMPNYGITPCFHPIATATFLKEVGKLQIGSKLRYAFWHTVSRIKGAQKVATKPTNPALESRFGVKLPLADDDSRALLDEVRRYKWLEAERAGRDIWQEKDPRDPDAVAFREWFERHFGAWYLHRLCR